MNDIDKYTRCSCGHIAAHHSVVEPGPCRVCDCEGFYLVRGDTIITMWRPQ